jgi:6-phosphogluconolactonase (cycloisomerase 2 family)
VLKVNSDGTTTPAGNLIPFNSVLGAPVIPSKLVIDAAGKFLFVADRSTTNSAGQYLPGAVSAFAIGSGGSLTEVAGSPFVPSLAPTFLQQAGLDIVDVAPTPTVFPPIGINGVQNSVCSAPGLNPPTSEYLYAVDGLGNQVFEFGVNTTSGVLTLSLSPTVGIPTDAIPAGVAVDPCDRFVYVTGSQNDRVSAYTICNGSATQSTQCPMVPDWSLQPVAGSPFSLSGSANRPGPLVVDPFGNFVYVLSTNSNTISPLRISPVSGALSALSPATVATGSAPKSIVIRGDDNWMFVTNFNSPSSISQYAITPASGALTAQPNIPTDNYPWGVAVK